MRQLRPLAYFVRQAWRQLVRDRSLTVTAVLANLATFFVSALFLLIAWNLHAGLESIRAQREVQVFLDRTLDEASWKELGEKLRGMYGVAEVALVTPEEAMEEFETEFGESGLVAALGENPLPPTYRLGLDPDHRSPEAIDAIAQRAGALAGVEEVRYGGRGIAGVEARVRTFATVTTIIGLLAAISAAMIIANTSRLTILARKELVLVLRQIGARDGFIRVPFLLEGMLQGVAAGVGALGMLWLVHWLVATRVAGVVFFSGPLTLTFVGFAAVLGGAGAFAATLEPLRARWQRRAALVALLLVGLAHAASAQRAEETEVELDRGRRELQMLTEEIKRTERRVASLRTREAEVTTTLVEIDKGIQKAGELAVAYDRQSVTLEADIARRVTTLADTQQALEDTRRRLLAHIDRVYRRGKPAYLAVVMGAEDFGGVLRRVRYVGSVLAAERALVEEYNTRKARAAEELGQLQARRTEFRSLKTDQEREQERLQRLRRERGLVLAATRDEREAGEEAITELQANAARLQEVIARLERERAAQEDRERRGTADALGPRATFVPTRPFAGLEGRLAWPLRGEILSSFGTVKHPRYGTSTFSPGIDVRAREGEEVVAVAEGQVEFVDWVKGYGKTVILSHGEGFYSLYAHASRVLVRAGDRVSAGTPIALAGSTDSLHGTCLHFELRKGGRAVDPLGWLGK